MASAVEEDDRLIRRFQHDRPVIEYAITSDGRTIVSRTSSDFVRTLNIWDVWDGSLIRQIVNVRDYALSRDGQRIALTVATERESVWTTSVTIEDIRTGRVLNTLNVPFTVNADPDVGLFFSNDDRNIITFAFDPDSNNRQLSIYSIANGQRVYHRISVMDQHCDGRYIIIYQGRLRMLNTTTLVEMELPDVGYVRDVHLDGSVWIRSDSNYLYSPDDRYRKPKLELFRGSIVTSASGRIVVGTDYDTYNIYTKSGRGFRQRVLSRQIVNDEGPFYPETISDDESMLVTERPNGHIRVVDLASGRLVASFNRLQSLKFVPTSSNHIAAIDENSGSRSIALYSLLRPRDVRSRALAISTALAPAAQRTNQFTELSALMLAYEGFQLPRLPTSSVGVGAKRKE